MLIALLLALFGTTIFVANAIDARQDRRPGPSRPKGVR